MLWKSNLEKRYKNWSNKFPYYFFSWILVLFCINWSKFKKSRNWFIQEESMVLFGTTQLY